MKRSIEIIKDQLNLLKAENLQDKPDSNLIADYIQQVEFEIAKIDSKSNVIGCIRTDDFGSVFKCTQIDNPCDLCKYENDDESEVCKKCIENDSEGVNCEYYL